MTPIFTGARLAVWQALDNFSGLQAGGISVFNRTYRFDVEMALMNEISPAFSDLPALALLPISVTPEWWTSQMQQWPLVLELTLWTRDWRLDLAEQLIEQVGYALFQSQNAQGVPFIKAATGYYPRQLGPITFTPTRTGGERKTKAVQTRMTLGLRLAVDPLAD